MLTSAKNETVKFRDDREIYQCTRKRQGCTRKRHASGRSQPSQHLRLHSLRSVDTNNAPSNLCGGEREESVRKRGQRSKQFDKDFFHELKTERLEIWVNELNCLN